MGSGFLAALDKETYVSFDERLFTWINNLGGHVDFIDRIVSGFANDYFILIAMCLVLVGMWFGTRPSEKRLHNQVAVLKAMASLGTASGFASIPIITIVGNEKYAGTLLYSMFNRPRPFETFGPSVVHHFYFPHDPSFPSNMAAAVFGLALAVWLMNRRVGTWLLIMASLVCLARIYVGVHYPSDILGGFVIAVVAVGVIYFMFWVFKLLLRLLLWIMKGLYVMG
jgi:undecaprenyl-diphosphatase